MKIQILIGMIASGKSSYTKIAAANGYIVVNDDSIVNLLHGDDYTLYNEKLKPLYKSTENHIIGVSLAMGIPVIVDRGLNINNLSRRRFISLAQSLDLPCEAVVFDNQGVEVHAKRRFQTDPRGHTYEYWLKVASYHHNRWVLPTIEEGFDRVHFISFDEIKAGILK